MYLSFAGLKTAILKISQNIKTEKDKYDLAASFQKTIIDILIKKTAAFLNIVLIIKTKNL